MGFDICTYVGPYFRCTPSTGTVENKVRGCPNVTCKESQHNIFDNKKNFCEVCGTAITDYTYTKQAILQHAGRIASEDLKDRLSSVNFGEGAKYHLYIPNVNNFGRHIRNKCDTKYIDLSELDIIAKERALLETKFKVEYEYLKNQYGTDNVIICWGVLCYMH